MTEIEVGDRVRLDKYNLAGKIVDILRWAVQIEWAEGADHWMSGRILWHDAGDMDRMGIVRDEEVS